MSYEKTKEQFKKHGWSLDCYSPFEISTSDGSVATGEAANIVQYYIEKLDEEEASEPQFIDHLSLISPNPVTKEDEIRINSIMEDFNKLRKELNLTMIVNGKTWNL